jgi:O-antigen/teichoic acid export membrane protein
MGIRMSVKGNTVWNLAGSGLPLILGAITIPFLIRSSSVEAFGILTIVWALIGYFSLFDFGLGRALTQQVAAASSADQLIELPSLIKTGLWFTAATGVVGGITLAALASQLAHNWLNVSDTLQQSAYHALLIAAIGIPLTTLTTGLRGVLEGYEDFKAVNLMRIGLGAANFGFPALSVILINNSLVWMVASLVFSRALVLIGHMWLVHKRLPFGLASSRTNRKKLRGLLTFGAWMTVTNIVGPLMVTADRFIISAVQGASMVAYYTLPFEVVTRLLILPGALTTALFPRLAFLITTDPLEALRLYKKCMIFTIIIMLPICLIIALGAKWGLTLWLGKEFGEQSWLILSILAAGVFLNGVAYVPFATIQATGDARSTALLHISELIIYLPVLFFTLNYFGLTAAAAVWTARVGIDLIALLIIVNNKFNGPSKLFKSWRIQK